MKTYFALLLITLVFGHGLQVEEKIEEEDRRELLAITGAVVLAACISGAVGGIVGAVSAKGIDACGGRRDKTIVVVRDESGNYRQKDARRRLLVKDDGLGIGAEQNKFGVLFEGDHTCPEDAEHSVVALQKHADGSVTLPMKYFDEDIFSNLHASQQAMFQKITPKETWKRAINKVILANRQEKAKKAQVVQAVKQASDPSPNLSSDYVEIGSKNAKSSVTMQYLPHFAFAVALSLLGVFTYRKNNEQKTFVHEELLDPTL